LLRHRGAHPWPRSRQAGFANSALIANIDVAIAHDCSSFVEADHNAQLPGKVARHSLQVVRLGMPREA
jgi:hypothetical protein